MKWDKVSTLFDFLPKSKIKAGDGQETGEYPMYTSSETQSKYLDQYLYEPVCLVFGTGGKASVHLATSRFATSTDCITIRPKPNVNIDAGYVFQYLKSNIQILENGFKGAGLKHISKAYISNIHIPYPENIDDQIRIATLLNRVEALIATRKKNLDQLDDFLKSIFLEMFGDPVKNEKGWKKKPLSVLGSVNRGVSKHRPRNAPELLGGDYPLIQTGEVTNSGTYITEFKHTYSEIGFNQSKLWPAGTLCITIAANIAQTSILTFDACFPDSVVGFVADEHESDVLYIHFLFSFFQRKLEKNAPKAAQKNINLNILRNLEVPAPPIPLQKKFSNIVNKVELLKKAYQLNLDGLRSLYGAIRQKAFKGEIDLSRVPIDIVIQPGPGHLKITGHAPTVTVTDEVRVVEYPMSVPEERSKLLRNLFDKYLKEYKDRALKFEDFWQQASFKTIDMMDEFDKPWNADDYDQVKAWLFDLIREGEIEQALVMDTSVSPAEGQIELKVKG